MSATVGLFPACQRWRQAGDYIGDIGRSVYSDSKWLAVLIVIVILELGFEKQT